MQTPQDYQVQSRMTVNMNQHYGKIKDEIGVDENFGLEEEDPQLDDVIKELRGNIDPMNFKSHMRKEQQVFKNSE